MPLLVILLVTFLFSASCKRGGYQLPYTVDKATIIGNEICNQDESKDYWLLNIDGNYGDTLTYNGTLYRHVVKTEQLDSANKRIGRRIVCGFDISQNKVESPGCTVPFPETYRLSVITLHLQGELR